MAFKLIQIIGDEVPIGDKSLVHLFLQMRAFAAIMDDLDNLLQPDGEQETDRDHGNMHDEIAPVVNALLRCVNMG